MDKNCLKIFESENYKDNFFEELSPSRNVGLYKVLSFLFMLLFFGLSAYAQPNGEQLFKANCSACHAIDKKLVGPALQGIEERRQMDWLIKWVKNSQDLVKSGDAYAVKIFEEYNKIPMTAFTTLSDDDIKAIFTYVKDEEAKLKAGATASKDTSAGKTTAAQQTTATGQHKFTPPGSILFPVSIITAFGLFLILLIAAALQKGMREKTTQQPYAYKESLMAMLKNPFVIAGFGFVILCVVGGFVVEKARAVGVKQYYQPTQPIAYSHKLHAGQYQISCNYCHVGVEKSKNATIPSVNICMNCHIYTASDKPEIQKLYKAKETGQPIKWVRVHNLPDFVSFNHSMHVKGGKLECQTCHGQVQEMEVVYQYAPLTMGWCINCHRETEVDVAKNDYYLKVHDELQKGKIGKEEKITVAKLGGIDCARCHY